MKVDIEELSVTIISYTLTSCACDCILPIAQRSTLFRYSIKNPESMY